MSLSEIAQKSGTNSDTGGFIDMCTQKSWSSNLIKAILGVAFALGFLASTAIAQGNRPPVSWEPGGVAQTIGNGSIASPTIVRFRVSEPLTNVTVFTVPEIRDFVATQPSEFAVLQPGTEYALRLSFSVPPRATQGLHEGTIHLRIASRTIPEMLKVRVTVDYAGNTPSPVAVSLTLDSLRLITSVAPGGSGLYFSQSTPELSAIVPGAILVLPPGPQIPSGFLGKVINTTSSNGQLFISTIAASLSEVFVRASASLNYTLDQQSLSSGIAATTSISLRNRQSTTEVIPSSVGEGISVRLDDLVVYDRDGNPATTSDQIVLDGGITIGSQLHFSFDVDNFHLNQLAFSIELNENVELAIKSRLEATLFEGEKEFARYRWNPITVWVGWIPVVIVPEVSLVARAEGTASVGIEVRVDQAASLTAGVGLANGSWHPIADFSSSFSFSGPSFTAGANIKGRVGPRFKLLLYGVVGPRADVDAFGEIDVDIFRTPIWQIFGGLEGNAGVLLQIFDHTIADQEFPLLIQFRRLLAEGGIGAQGRIIGNVRDAITRQPLPNAVVAVFRDGNLIDSLLTNGSGEFSLSALVGAIYRFEISRLGYLPVTYSNVSVLAHETKTLDVILQIDTAHSGLGNVSGAIFNAISGAGVQGLTVRLREGINTSSGPVVATTTTGPGGIYSFSNLQAGNYTAEGSGTGFTTTYFTVLCIGNDSTGNQNGVISPILSPGETRIVLSWGASPSDLDSHFTGPLPDGSRFHMYYPYSGTSSAWPSIVNLDRDDVTSFGPETTTLLQQIDGVYRFSVHDYSNRFSTNSTALSESQAQVRVYRGGDIVATFNVPLGQPGTLWTVFEMEGSTIRPINAMSYVSTPGSITAPTLAPEYDRLVLQDIPAKR